MNAPRDTVLVVDDSPETLGFLTEALEETGVVVLVATSGRQALAIAERATPDIILMDAVMPEMDGFTACRRLKAMASVADVPVIFMTGLTDTEHVVEGLSSGGVDYLTKPIDIDELQARIRVHLANARMNLSAKAALDAAGRHLMALGPDGGLRWATPQAARIVEALGDDRLALAFGDWLKRRGGGGQAASFDIDDDGAAMQLTFLGMPGADEYLFRLTRDGGPDDVSRLRAGFGLTAREAEVLLWIGRGKANKDIGEILGLSPRTVNKHLEQIYVKLGVENRASAAVKAMQALAD